MPDIPWTVILLIALALVFDFLNGFHDSANIVATMIASRALSGRQALTITAIAEFIGPFLFGVAVATTIGHEVLHGEEIRLSVVIAALHGRDQSGTSSPGGWASPPVRRTR